MDKDAALPVDVFGASGARVASFASALEACRYAALICELDRISTLRSAEASGADGRLVGPRTQG